MTVKPWNTVVNDLRKILPHGVRAEEPMARHTTIGAGGPARVLAVPSSFGQVVQIVRYARAHDINYIVVGKGSNLIVRDGGYDGVIIKMGSRLARIRPGRNTVLAEGGASFPLLSRKLTRAGRTGLEFGLGIPGTVGGAVKMNAGAFGGEVSQVLRRVRLVDVEGTEQVLYAKDIQFSYRRTSLPVGCVVLSATFMCPPGKVDKETCQRSIARKDTQPIDARSFGSTFVNPDQGYAARMIEDCGLKGTRRGGAVISEKHANFIVNVGDDTKARDVEGLIRLMRNEVRKKFGVTLKTEVIIVGNG